jgi:hypothetical protein
MTDSSPSRAQGAGRTPESGAPDRLSVDARVAAFAAKDWSEAPFAGLGRVMARRDLDLATALGMFFGGGPERFNYLPKPQVPEDYRPVARHLDNICLRINSGFYLPQPQARITCRPMLDRWLACQRADRREGRCGRWVLNEAMLAPLLDSGRCRAPQAPPPPAPDEGRLWRAILAPLRGLPRPRAFMRRRK